MSSAPWLQYAQPQASTKPWEKYGPSVSESGQMQGESPNYGPDVTVTNPTMSQMGMGVLREGAQLLSGAHGLGKSAIEMIPGVKGSRFDQSMQQHQAKLDEMAKPQNMGEAMGKTGGEMASYLAPARLETGIAEMAPEALRPLARIGTSALSSGTMSRMNGGGFTGGALTGGGIGAAGELGRGVIAPALMRSAIPGNVSKDTANALLRETNGMRPSTVLKSTEGRIGQASNDLDASIRAANMRSRPPIKGFLMPPAQETPLGPGGVWMRRPGMSASIPPTTEPNGIISMQPSRQPLQSAMGTARSQEAGKLHDEISDMADFLRTGRVSGESIPDVVTPQRALDLRRGFNEQFLGNRDWKKVVNDRATAAGKQAYGGLTSELHAKVPGAVEADKMMSDLIPARSGLKTLVRNDPSIVGNVAGRVGARTGALTSMALGAGEGARTGGLPGAILGGGLGLTLPEVASAPAAKMGVARALYSTMTPKLGRAAITPAVEHLISSLRGSRTGGQAQ